MQSRDNPKLKSISARTKPFREITELKKDEDEFKNIQITSLNGKLPNN